MTVPEKISQFLQSQPEWPSPNRRLRPQESLIASGLLDSVAILKLVAFIEQEYDIQLAADDVTLENFDSLEAISRTLAGYSLS